MSRNIVFNLNVHFCLQNPPSVTGLICALESKYRIDAKTVRHLYLKSIRGGGHNEIRVKIDDDMLKYYLNGDTFLMEVNCPSLLNTKKITFFWKTVVNKLRF